MADTGFKFPGTMVGNRAIVGADVTWTDADNAKADDGSLATCTVTGTQDSFGLAASNFDFSSIPAGATIDGIEIRVGDYKNSTGPTEIWPILRLILSDNSDGSDDKSAEMSAWSIFLQTDEAGGATELWGENLTRADVQDVNFGFFHDVHTLGPERNYEVDFMQMRVFYHEGVPTTIVNDVGLAGHHPPYISSAGATYSVIRADPNELDVKKTTDPENADLWTVKDSASGPVHVGTLLGYATYQDGDSIHIVAWSAGTYEYYTFDMSTDTWDIDELMETPNDAPTFPWASLAVRSDGDVLVFYAGDTVKFQGKERERVYLARREGGVWTTGIALDSGGSVHYGNPNVVKGPLTDDMHSIWQTTSNSAIPPTAWTGVEARTLDPSNNLSIKVTDTLDTENALLGMQNAVSYDDSGTQRMLFAGISGASGRPRIYVPATEDGSDDISIGTTVSDTAGDDGFVNGEAGICSIAELDGVLHQLYSGGGTDGVDQDLFYTTSIDDGATWSTPTVELSGVTVNFISANIYVRGIDTVLAYVYEDDGKQLYNEKVLIAGQTHQMMM